MTQPQPAQAEASAFREDQLHAFKLARLVFNSQKFSANGLYFMLLEDLEDTEQPVEGLTLARTVIIGPKSVQNPEQREAVRTDMAKLGYSNTTRSALDKYYDQLVSNEHMVLMAIVQRNNHTWEVTLST
jgi:hypothetical protein